MTRFRQSGSSLAFMSIVFVQSAVVLSLEGYIFGKFQANINTSYNLADDERSVTVAIPTYLALFIFGEVYSLVLAYDSLRLRNTIQAIGLTAFNIAMMVYAGIQYEQIKSASLDLSSTGALAAAAWSEMNAYVIALIAVIGVCTIPMGIMCFYLFRDFGWFIYKQLGADISMKHRYLALQIFTTLLKFDFFFFLGFTIQFVVIVLNTKDVEFALTIAVIPFTIAVLVGTYFFVIREFLPGMVVVISIFFASMAYFIFKLARMYQPSQAWKYVAARKSLTTFAVLTLVFITVTIINAIICTRNFDKGLKQYAVVGTGVAGIFCAADEDEEEKYARNTNGETAIELRPRFDIE
ncbi:uncharacterized protein V1518DRAFT_376497 [Limtongia smithiae]|uniref:uncharacterized protein n=1 Tax=Limtongia smithiae TaxID=1125753 RepID=UPI0034CD86CB